MKVSLPSEESDDAAGAAGGSATAAGTSEAPRRTARVARVAPAAAVEASETGHDDADDDAVAPRVDPARLRVHLTAFCDLPPAPEAAVVRAFVPRRAEATAGGASAARVIVDAISRLHKVCLKGTGEGQCGGLCRTVGAEAR